jgi:uncharacterized membrane protein YkgB
MTVARPPINPTKETLMAIEITARGTHSASYTAAREASSLGALAATIENVGAATVRYGLVLALAWIGAMKFTAYEAGAIQPLVANSPLLSWTYGALSVQGLSNLVGGVEIALAILIALRPISAALSAVGSLLAAGTFLTTLSFLLSTPGWEASLGGFPALSVVPGQFLLKDVVLLGAAIWSAGEALRHLGR